MESFVCLCTACTQYCTACGAAGPGLCDAGMCISGYRRNAGQTCEGTTSSISFTDHWLTAVHGSYRSFKANQHNSIANSILSGNRCRTKSYTTTVTLIKTAAGSDIKSDTLAPSHWSWGTKAEGGKEGEKNVPLRSD